MHLPPTLQAIQTALDQGNAALARDLLFQLGPEERRALSELLGAEPAERLYRTARRGTRAIKRGRVAVLPGITGSELLAEYADGKGRLLWVDFISLVLGRTVALLALNQAGEPADASVRITPRGFVLGWYLNLVTSLQNEWDVLPVSYDWRLDIDHSADALAERITRWARNEPVHIVAHSMGGLVSRRMIQRHPELWAAMDIGGASDDHVRLFDPAAWGDVPVQPPLLARAHRFARELHGVVDADRMVYVAGYGQGTPSPVRVRGPGRFEYQRTFPTTTTRGRASGSSIGVPIERALDTMELILGINRDHGPFPCLVALRFVPRTRALLGFTGSKGPASWTWTGPCPTGPAASTPGSGRRCPAAVSPTRCTGASCWA